MKKQLYALVALVVVATMLLTACGGTETIVETVIVTQEVTVEVEVEGENLPAVGVRWFVGLGTGTDPAQIEIEQAVVDAFNATHPDISLTLEVVPYDSAKDTLATQIAAGVGPDVIGPVGWAGSNAFYGQWADISAFTGDFDTSIFNPALVAMYQTEEGQVGLPFAVYPSVLFYIPSIFDDAGLAYPPANYGDKYTLNGAEVEWSWDTIAEVGKLLTIDVNGNNATSADFDRTQIVQFGYHWVWENHTTYLGAFFQAGTALTGTPGNYAAVIPDVWKTGWKWAYEGIWGDQPFIPNNAVGGSADFGSGNTFSSGKIAMSVNPNWYLCCLGNLNDIGVGFDLAAMPSYNGVVAGRIDADTFRVWKGTKKLEQAVEVVKWLVTDGEDALVVGTADQAPAYGAVPAVTDKQQPFLDAKAAQYPSVTNWDVMMAGLSYPDVPSAEGYMPNFNEAWTRFGTLGDLMFNTEGLDMDAEIATLEADLTVIFNK